MPPSKPKTDQTSRRQPTAPSTPPSASELTVDEAAKKVGERNREALTELAKW